MSYEIEIKSLLGAPEKADELREKLHERYPDTKRLSHHKQLNHYFEGGDVQKLQEVLAPHLSDEAKTKLADIIERGSDFSIRTRAKDDEVLVVVKASVDEGTSANTVSRLEFEEPVDCSLDELDELLLGAGFSYQAKWSREREEYQAGDINVCLDKNAGYGYLAEFEKVVDGEDEAKNARAELDEIMQELGVEELPQDRLERMFAHYNANWPDYYGTEKIFHIE